MKTDQDFLADAERVARWSLDPSTKVGAVVVKGGEIVGAGFNAFPLWADQSSQLYADRSFKIEHIRHAEQNAVEQAGFRARGSTIYVTMPPCRTCATIIQQASIKRVVAPAYWPERWAESILKAAEFLRFYEIEVDYV